MCNNSNNILTPLVSILTPGWNGKGFVHRLLDSLLEQTYDNLEYIYVDDGSTDGTKDIVLSYEDKFKNRGIPFIYIYKENGGLCSAIQEGLKHVNGKYLCWPEYDDILFPDAMEKRVNFLETHPDCAVVTCDALITPIEDLDNPIGLLSGNNPNRYDRNHFVQLLTGNSIFTAACHMVRMDVFDATHPNREIYQSRVGAIWQMLLPIYYKYNRGFIEDPLVKWVIRKDSISNKRYSIDKRLQTIEEFCKIRMNVLQSMVIPAEDKNFYIKLVLKITADSYIKYGLDYQNKKLFYRGYDYYQKNNIHITKDIVWAKLQIGIPVLFHILNLYNKTKCLIIKNLRMIYHMLLKHKKNINRQKHRRFNNNT